MANHREHGEHDVHNPLDAMAWPVALTAPLVWPVSPWAVWLWEHAPTPTALYMVVSAGFMLFQMSDKLGWLDRFKKRSLEDVPNNPEN